MYKTSSQLKRETKDRLKGRWGEAVTLNLVPTAIQIIVFIIIGFILLIAFLTLSLYLSHGGDMSDSYFMSSDAIREGNGLWNSAFGNWGLLFSFSYSRPVVSILFSFINIGIAFTFLDVIRKGRKQQLTFNGAFRLFNWRDFVPILIINVLMAIFTFLWSFLFVIPGIIKGYAYSQSNFIYKDLATHEDISRVSATHIITESRSLMNGHKWRLFWLDISFIGWYLVGICTFGIGFLWINPYINATKAAFYADLAKDKYLDESLHTELETDGEWTSF